MRSILEISLCALALNFTSTTLAAWHSGGGELIRDGRNPWFIGKATQASYCIKTSEDFPIQDHDRLDQAIRYAIDFWQERIELAEPYRKALLTDGSKIQVGPGTFSRKTCDGSEDIAFQFGYLNDLQRRALIDPQNFAAITIRTDYDEVNLRGKGFVFVSTDRGPNAFKGDGLVRDAWTAGEGNLLRLTLTHELGHVYGIPHVDRNVVGHSNIEGLMDEHFVERILDAQSAPMFASRYTPGFLIKKYDQENGLGRILYCFNASEGHPAAHFFGMEPNAGRCLRFEPSGKTYSVQQINPSKDDTDPGLILGTISFDAVPGETPRSPGHSNFKVAHVYLTPKQRVIQPIGGTRSQSLPVLEAVTFKMNGIFRSVKPLAERPLLFTMGAGEVDLSTQVGDQVYERLLLTSLSRPKP